MVLCRVLLCNSGFFSGAGLIYVLFFFSNWTVYIYISLVCYSSFFTLHDIRNNILMFMSIL